MRMSGIHNPITKDKRNELFLVENIFLKFTSVSSIEITRYQFFQKDYIYH